MIRCNNCGTDNLDGSEYCDECGMKLSASVAPSLASAPQGVKPSASAPPMSGIPQMPSVGRAPVAPAPPQAGAGNAQMARPNQPVASARSGMPDPPPPPSFSPSAMPKGAAPPPYASSASARTGMGGDPSTMPPNPAMAAGHAPMAGSYGKAGAG
jgi:hypothetical protein